MYDMMYSLVKFSDDQVFHVCPRGSVKKRHNLTYAKYGLNYYLAELLCNNRDKDLLEDICYKLNNGGLYINLFKIPPDINGCESLYIHDNMIIYEDKELFEELQTFSKLFYKYNNSNSISEPESTNINTNLPISIQSDIKLIEPIQQLELNEDADESTECQSLVENEYFDSHPNTELVQQDEQYCSQHKSKNMTNDLNPINQVADLWHEELHMPVAYHEDIDNEEMYGENGTRKMQTVMDASSKIVILEDVTFHNGIPLSKEQKADRKPLRSCKKNFCIYCHKLVTNFNRHMKTLHKDEPRVKEILSEIGKISQQKKKQFHRLFSGLRNEGNKMYNKDHSSQQCIPLRNSNKPGDTYYVICEKCKGYFSKKGLRNHIRNYCERPDNVSQNLVGPARVNTFPLHPDVSELFKTEILIHLKNGKRQEVMCTDPTIVFYGNFLTRKLCSNVANKGKRYVYIGNELRLLVDIFENMKKIDPEKIKEVRDIFWPDQYENIVEAIKQRAQYNPITGSIISSVPSRACTTLKKVTQILRCNIIKLPNNEKEAYQEEDNKLKNLEYLLTQLMSYDITRLAGDTRIRQQRSKVTVLPTTEQIGQLMSSLEKELTTTFSQASKNCNYQNYSKLARAVMTYIMVFNRRRPGDCEKTLVDEYQNLSKCDSEFLSKLSDNDRPFAEKFGRYKAQGKLNKKASNLVTEQLYKPIEFLISHRSEIGIKKEDPFLFANPKSKRLLYFSAGESLRRICSKYKLDPTLLTATNLRKHLATATSHLQQDTQNIISDFMGHSLGVHTNIYQQKELHTDIVTMGRVLLECAGLSKDNKITKPITEENAQLSKPPTAAWLTTNDLADLQDDDEEFIDFSNILSTSSSQNTINISTDDNQQEKSLSAGLSPLLEVSGNSSADKSQSPGSHRSRDRSKKRYIKVSPPLSRKRWSTPQRKEVTQMFGHYIERNELPGINDITMILKNHNYTSSTPNRVSVMLRNLLKNKKEKKCIKNHWTTEQVMLLQAHFKDYFDIARSGIRDYPSTVEIEQAIDSIPQLKSKDHRIVRSKLQHLFMKIDKEQIETDTDSE